MVPPLRGPTRRAAARSKKSGRSGRDDRNGKCKKAAYGSTALMARSSSYKGSKTQGRREWSTE
jgi:hypothetical protein